MPKAKTVYVCQNCEYKALQWVGQCPQCEKWNTFVESVVTTAKARTGFSGSALSAPVKLSEVALRATNKESTGIGELDRVLGGGMAPGQVILIAGEPGIGKSTLITQLAQKLGSKSVLYVCGEESPQQIKIRAQRMGYKGENLLMLAETNADVVAEVMVNGSFDLVIVDSIQTMNTDQLTGTAGSVGQVRECAQKLAGVAKKNSTPLVLVGHVTKEGVVAGPKVLEHVVDTVLYLEGDTQHVYRMLKTAKNRFGAVSEVGLFELTDAGLIEVKNPSEMFLPQQKTPTSGSCVTVVMEGFRPILFEIQALVTKTAFGYPIRTTSGFNVNRLKVLIAILEKRCGLNLSNSDVFVNVAGGYKIDEYAADLAVCLAVASSLKDVALPAKSAAFGECGLSGEVREVQHQTKRTTEAKKLGYTNVISPPLTIKKVLAEYLKK